MDKKDPIPFRARQRQHRAARKVTPPRQRPVPRPPSKPGELDDVRAYWTRLVHEPFAGPGRFYWTDRMLWGNALLTALASMVITAVRLGGLHILALFSEGINTFFVFFLVYYLFSWVCWWLLVRLGQRQASVDTLKLDMIVVSGWLAMVVLLGLVPYLQPWLYSAALLGFAVLTVRAVRRSIRAPWSASMMSAAGGLISVLLVQIILTRL